MATVFCFSSTGNSLRAANIIAEAINANVFSMAKPVDVCNDDVIGFVFPTFFWGLPKTVDSFIKGLEITNRDAYIFAVATYGGVTTGVTGKVNKILRQKGRSLSYGKLIKSVENYIPGYKVNDSPEFQEEIETAIKKSAGELAAGKHKKSGAYTIINKLIHKFYPANGKNCDIFFTVDDICQKCGACQKICPRGNIGADGGKPVFRHNCELCLACLHICPAQAINWKNKTAGKKRYRNPHVTEDELLSFNRTNQAFPSN